MIKLISKDVTITKILKKTTAVFFKDLVVGDVLRFSVNLERPGRSGYYIGPYAQEVKITKVTTGTFSTRSMTNLVNLLDNFELEEIE